MNSLKLNMNTINLYLKFLMWASGVLFASFCPNLIAEDAIGKQEAPAATVVIQKKAPPQYSIQLLQPTSEETFQNSAQSITVKVNVQPALEPGDKIEVYVDNEKVAEAETTEIQIPWLPRGSHTIQAKVIQVNGPGAETEVITFFQQRSSLQLPPNGNAG